MDLLIDIGNTRIKSMIWKDGAIPEYSSTLQEVSDLYQSYTIKRLAYTTVREEMHNWDSFFPDIPKIAARMDSKLPFTSVYQSSGTLGQDRIAAISGAIKVAAGKDFLVIDAGTCITYDLVDKNKIHYGGSISPGLTLRLKALHNYTSRLPLLTLPDHLPQLPGNDTATSILTGTISGVLMEIDGMIDEYRGSYPDLQVVMTGGDMPFLAKGLKNAIFADPMLIFNGLHVILELNAPQ